MLSFADSYRVDGRILTGFFIFLVIAAEGQSVPAVLIEPCSTDYRHLKQIPVSDPSPYIPFATLQRELPWMPDPERLKADLPARVKAWTKDHPGEPENFPFPENRTGVEWAKSVVSELETDPYYRYRDQTTRLLTQADRKATTERLKRELSEIEARKYPMKDTIRVVTRLLTFIGRIDRAAPSPDSFVRAMEVKLGSPLAIDQAVLDELVTMWRAANKGLGLERRELQIRYEKALVAAVDLAAGLRGLRADALQTLRREQYRFRVRLDDDDGNDLLAFHIDRDPEKLRPVILVPGQISNRALAEMTIFEIDGGGLVKYYVIADSSPVGPHRFLSHDTNHAGITRRSKIANELIGRSALEKHKLFAAIDSISQPRQKQLAEGMLVIALRESVDYLLVADRDAVADFQHIWKLASGESVSEVEARWMADWWSDNLPTSKSSPKR
jgi:hypothetical protein